MENIRTIENLELPVQHINTKQLIKQYSYVRQADLKGLSAIRPLLLIGQDNCALIVSKDVIQVEVNAPILSRNKLGWVVHGPAEFPNNMKEAIVNLCCERKKLRASQKICKKIAIWRFYKKIYSVFLVKEYDKKKFFEEILF
jgi:hypothetical protein